MMKNRILGLIHSILAVLIWCLTLGISAPAFGPDDSPRHLALPADDAQVAALLSERPFEERVWTIYRIGREKRHGLIPNLIERLDLDRYPKYEAELALDALFRLEAFVPDEILLKLLNDFPTKAAIMLAFKPQRHEKSILEMIGRNAAAMAPKQYLRAVLAANLALKAGTPGFANLLLERRLKASENRMAVDLEIRRKRNENPKPAPGGLGCSCGRGCSALDQEAKFPPVYWTELTDWPLATPFVAGPGHVAVNSLECSLRSAPSSSVNGFSKAPVDQPVFKSVSDEPTNRGEWLFEAFLSALVGENTAFRQKKTVVWKGRRAFIRQVEQARAGGEAHFRWIVNRLMERGLLARDDADSFKPEFVVRILNPDGLPIPQLLQTVPGDRK